MMGLLFWFSVAFIVFSFDVYMHAPLATPYAKEAALTVSIFAVVLQSPSVFVVAELTWLGVLLFIAAAPISKEKERKVEGGDWKGVDELPQSILNKVNVSLELFIKNLNSTVNCDEEPWELQAEDTEYKVKVWSSAIPGAKLRRWKVEVLLEDCPLDLFVKEAIGLDSRAGGATGKENGGGWDKALMKGRLVHEFADGVHSIAVATTNAAAGGAIAPREFCDVRAFHTYETSLLTPKGGLLMTMMSLDKDDKQQLPAIAGCDGKDAIRGINIPGAGMRVSPIDGKADCFCVETVSIVDLQGWIPLSLINSATCKAMLGSNKAMKKHLQRARSTKPFK